MEGLKFDTREFTRDAFCKAQDEIETSDDVIEGDYIGTIRVGNIAVDITVYREYNGVYTGISGRVFCGGLGEVYTDDGQDYGVIDDIDICSLREMLALSYDEFVHLAEMLITSFIKKHKLQDEADKPLSTW